MDTINQPALVLWVSKNVETSPKMNILLGGMMFKSGFLGGSQFSDKPRGMGTDFKAN